MTIDPLIIVIVSTPIPSIKMTHLNLIPTNKRNPDTPASMLIIIIVTRLNQ